MNSYILTGTYGGGHTPCDVFVYDNDNGSHWYAVEGSQNVNLTYDDIGNGVDVETLQDVDTFTLSENVIDGRTRMDKHCESYNEYLKEQGEY